jgi:transposase-like protein
MKMKGIARATYNATIDEAVEARDNKLDKYIAYCDCGDSLERSGLYPKDAKYYCIGCDKIFELAKLGGVKE